MAKQGQMDAVKIMAKEICQKVHADESQHSSSISENSDFEITISYGQRNEGCHKGNGQHEQTDEFTRDSENHDGI